MKIIICQMKVFYFDSNSLLFQKGFGKIFVHGERLQGSKNRAIRKHPEKANALHFFLNF